MDVNQVDGAIENIHQRNVERGLYTQDELDSALRNSNLSGDGD